MNNLIKSELYRISRTTYYRVIVAILSLITIGGIVMFDVIGSGDKSISFMLMQGMLALGFPIFLMPMFSELAFNGDFKDGTIKNTVASGLSRGKIIIGKSISILILAILAEVIVLILYALLSLLLLDPAKGDLFLQLKIFFKAIGASMFIWIGALSLSNMFAIIFKTSNKSTMAYYLFDSILGILFLFLNWLTKMDIFKSLSANLILRKHTLYIGQTYEYMDMAISNKILLKGIGVGIFYTVICILISLIFFKRRDV